MSLIYEDSVYGSHLEKGLLVTLALFLFQVKIICLLFPLLLKVWSVDHLQ